MSKKIGTIDGQLVYSDREPVNIDKFAFNVKLEKMPDHVLDEIFEEHGNQMQRAADCMKELDIEKDSDEYDYYLKIYNRCEGRLKAILREIKKRRAYLQHQFDNHGDGNERSAMISSIDGYRMLVKNPKYQTCSTKEIEAILIACGGIKS